MNYKINLIKKSALNYQARRLIFMVMYGYLMMSSLVLAAMALGASAGYGSLQRYKADIKAAEVSLQAQARNLAIDFTQPFEMRTVLDENIQRLGAFDEALRNRYDFGSVIHELSQGLPKDVYLDNVTFNAADSRINFEIVLAVNESSSSGSGSGIIETVKEKFAASGLGEIESSGSKRERREGQTFFILSFYCKLAS